MKMKKTIFQNKSQVFLDIGCGGNKRPGAIGVDFRSLPGVDIVQDLGKYPWTTIPSGIADTVTASHLLEHINPASSDPRLAGLINLLLNKKIITKKEVETFVGEYEFIGGLLRFMDEIWRILKPEGQLIASFPYAGSPGFWQDPTHLCPINHVTMAYFDPLAKDSSGNLYNLYTIYRPLPFKILRCFYGVEGFVEIAMEKRKIDKSYNCLSKIQ